MSSGCRRPWLEPPEVSLSPIPGYVKWLQASLARATRGEPLTHSWLCQVLSSLARKTRGDKIVNSSDKAKRVLKAANNRKIYFYSCIHYPLILSEFEVHINNKCSKEWQTWRWKNIIFAQDCKLQIVLNTSYGFSVAQI